MRKEFENNEIFKRKNSYNELIEKLYKDNYSYFYSIAYSILKNDADAKDAVNESFLKSYKYIEKISKIECPKIKAYFVNIVKGLSINMKKKQGKIIFSEFSEELIDSVACSEGADVLLEKMLENESLYSLLRELSIVEQSILEFKIIEGLTFKEISKIIGISEETTRKKYQRALKKLQK